MVAWVDVLECCIVQNHNGRIYLRRSPACSPVWHPAGWRWQHVCLPASSCCVAAGLEHIIALCSAPFSQDFSLQSKCSPLCAFPCLVPVSLWPSVSLSSSCVMFWFSSWVASPSCVICCTWVAPPILSAPLTTRLSWRALLATCAACTALIPCCVGTELCQGWGLGRAPLPALALLRGEHLKSRALLFLKRRLRSLGTGIQEIVLLIYAKITEFYFTEAFEDQSIAVK